MPDNVVVSISADAKKAEHEFDKVNNKVAGLTDKRQKMGEKNKIISDGIVKDFSQVSRSVSAIDANLAKLHLGMNKLKNSSSEYFTTMDSGSRFAFPKLNQGLDAATDKTGSLLMKTLGFTSALGLAYKTIGALNDSYKEMISIRDASQLTVSGAATSAAIGGGVKAKDLDKVSGLIGSLAKRTGGSIENTGLITKNLLSGGAGINNLNSFQSLYSLSATTGSKNAGGLAEAVMTGLKREGISPENATKAQVQKVTNMIFSAFGNDSEQSINAFKGVNNKISNEDLMALVSIAKENNAGDIRASVSEVQGATEKGINSITYKKLGTTKEKFMARKKQISEGRGLDEASAIFQASPAARLQNLKTDEAVRKGQGKDLTEEEKIIINKKFNESTGQADTIARMLSFLPEDLRYGIQDTLQDPWGTRYEGGKSLSAMRNNFQSSYLESQSRAFDIYAHGKAISKDGDTKTK